MATSNKDELVAHLELKRVRLERASAEAKAALDVKSRFEADYRMHTAVWIGAAAMLGLIISQIVKRRREPKVRQIKVEEESPFLKGAGRLLLSAATPIVAAWAKNSARR